MNKLPCDEADQEGVIPSGELAAEPDGVLDEGIPDQVMGRVLDGGDVLRRMDCSAPRFIGVKAHVHGSRGVARLHSLALRLAHSRGHQVVARHTVGFSHSVTSNVALSLDEELQPLPVVVYIDTTWFYAREVALQQRLAWEQDPICNVQATYCDATLCAEAAEVRALGGRAQAGTTATVFFIEATARTAVERAGAAKAAASPSATARHEALGRVALIRLVLDQDQARTALLCKEILEREPLLTAIRAYTSWRLNALLRVAQTCRPSASLTSRTVVVFRTLPQHPGARRHE